MSLKRRDAFKVISFLANNTCKLIKVNERIGYSLLIFNFCLAKRSRSSREEELISALISFSKLAIIFSTEFASKCSASLSLRITSNLLCGWLHLFCDCLGSFVNGAVVDDCDELELALLVSILLLLLLPLLTHLSLEDERELVEAVVGSTEILVCTDVC